MQQEEQGEHKQQQQQEQGEHKQEQQQEEQGKHKQQQQEEEQGEHKQQQQQQQEQGEHKQQQQQQEEQGEQKQQQQQEEQGEHKQEQQQEEQGEQKQQQQQEQGEHKQEQQQEEQGEHKQEQQQEEQSKNEQEQQQEEQGEHKQEQQQGQGVSVTLGKEKRCVRLAADNGTDNESLSDDSVFCSSTEYTFAEARKRCIQLRNKKREAQFREDSPSDPNQSIDNLKDDVFLPDDPPSDEWVCYEPAIPIMQDRFVFFDNEPSETEQKRAEEQTKQVLVQKRSTDPVLFVLPHADPNESPSSCSTCSDSSSLLERIRDEERQRFRWRMREQREDQAAAAEARVRECDVESGYEADEGQRLLPFPSENDFWKCPGRWKEIEHIFSRVEITFFLRFSPKHSSTLLCEWDVSPIPCVLCSCRGGKVPAPCFTVDINSRSRL